ncbi:hypothetical protein ABPG74_004338 [Tetrahymena malaccensis]
MSFTTSFSDIFDNQQGVLQTGYVHNNFSTFSFTNQIQNQFKLKAKVYQRIENNGTTSVHNNGLLELDYKNDEWKFSKKIDVNRNISMRIDKLLQQEFVKGHTVFGKFNKDSESQTESQHNPCIGVYKNFDRYAYKAKFNIETLVAQLKGKAVYDKHSSEDKEQYGTGVSASFDFKQNLFSNVKTLVYYNSLNTSMNMQYQMKRLQKIDDHESSSSQGGEIYYTFLYSLYQKLNDHLSIAVELNHDSNEKKFGMVFGGKYTKFDNVVCRAKIDDKFIVNSSFEIDINKNIKFTISNMIDLSLRNKKDATTTSSNYSFPIGFQLDIQQ